MLLLQRTNRDGSKMMIMLEQKKEEEEAGLAAWARTMGDA